MPDLIDQAVNKATAAASTAATGAAAQVSTAAATATTQATAAVNAAAAQAAAAGAAALASINDKLAALPMDKDPDVIKRQAEAKILEARAKAEELVIKAQEIAIEEVKKKLNSLKIPSLPFPLKLPLIDPKILGAAALLKQAKQLVAAKKKKIKKNLEDGRKLYRYDMKKIKPPGLPSVPKLPTLPNVPKLPTI